jgi:SAM-dependent methyltransferase
VKRVLRGIAKGILGLFPAYPSSEYVALKHESPDLALRRSQEEFDDERAGGFLKFFESVDGLVDVTTGSVLDLGCGFGGRTVEFEHRLKAHTVGLEIDERVGAIARRFAESKGAGNTSFVTGVGNALPFKNNSVDLILCYDVLEHVQDPEGCLRECWRVLKSGGRCYLVFPPYFHPTGAHLEGYVSRIPWTHLLFPSSVLLSAVDEILSERGDDYRPQPLRPGDRLYFLNGITISSFRRILRRSRFQVDSMQLLPLFSRLNRRYEAWRMRYYAWVFSLLTHIPVVQECFTHRIVAVLSKPDVP